jgi:(S)-2-hydroxyglutarate dehydrogenase
VAGESPFDVVVIGGGIVGLSAALACLQQRPGSAVVVLEKEPAVAAHQTGHNSGVIHSGIYYKPGSLKAQYCIEGNAEMVEFCQAHGIPYDICGKVIVATERSELDRLDALYQRAQAHGIAAERIGPAGIAEHEPHAVGIAGLWISSTGIVDYTAVSRAYAQSIAAAGGSVRLNTRVTGMHQRDGLTMLSTTTGDVRARFVVNCAGLHSDRMVTMAGATPPAKIVPFRGEYYELAPAARHLVRGLIYPVPDPEFPFLGVHFTRMIDGSVHAGPNAVLALRREGYRKRDISLRDTAETLRYPGFWRLARKHARSGAREMARSVSKQLFLRSLQRLVPAITRADLVPTHAGVRAQALALDGKLVDDFSFSDSPGALHVCNAPSPAATSSLPIGRAIAQRLSAD